MPHLIKGSFKANPVPPRMNRAVDIHLISNVFIINYTIFVIKCTIKNNCTLIEEGDIITISGLA
jgi:hypothetical protein